MSRYSIVETEPVEAALETTKACQHLAIDGLLEVTEPG